MIPIPWTHDQYENANRYVRSFNDILIDQKAKDYENNLKQTILSLNGFKKSNRKKDIQSEISKAKKEIANAIMQL